MGLLALPAPGAVDLFLDLPDLPKEGESRTPGYEGQIEILEWAVNVTKPETSVNPRVLGKTEISEIKILKELDKATPLLMERCATGTITPQMVIRGRKPDNSGSVQEYLVITMTDVVITSVKSSEDTDDSPNPAEEVALSFDEIDLRYTHFTDTGSEQVQFTFDRIAE